MLTDEIPYELIIPSASRPHLLEPVLKSIFQYVDVLPRRVLVHDDAAFPGRQSQVRDLVNGLVPPRIAVEFGADDPPISHGPTLHWLLQRVQTAYVLYSQDDHVVERPLPIRRCLDLMHTHHLHHVRFNKRATMEYKETWQGKWYKKSVQIEDVTLTIADHWYFQTSLWRVAPIREVVRWWMDDRHEGKSFHEHCEIKINKTLDGTLDHWMTGTLPNVRIPPDPREWRDHGIRQEYQRTYIWGPIGEERFIRHLGGDPKDWALPHPRGNRG